MSKPSIEHATVVVERDFTAPPARVFAAWADPEAQKVWCVPGEGWEIAEYESDFRVGGRLMSRFGPKGDPNNWDEGRYLDIAANERIISAGAMHSGKTRTSATLCTVEFHPKGTGTHLILTDQSVYLTLETPKDRTEGWGEILTHLAEYLER
jgi:uncharacterized protein YndB with AHSA1/START domain